MLTCDQVRQWLEERALFAGGAPDGEDGDGGEDAARAAHVKACPACRAEAETLAAILGELAVTQVAPDPAGADPALRARVLEGTRFGRPLASFAPRLARVFDLPVDTARALLAELESPAAWRPGVVPGCAMRPVRPGPAVPPPALGMLLRIEPGTLLPMHRHDGAEHTFVLAGGYRDSLGAEVWAGEAEDLGAGSAHEILGLGEAPCIAAVLVRGALRVV